MKMSSSGQNFPQTGLIRAQNTDTQPINSLKKVSQTGKTRMGSKKDPQINPSEFKKVLIHEVNELKQRMKDHLRHISKLSPERQNSKNSKHSRSASRSRSRKSRSPKQPQKARIPMHNKMKNVSQLSSAVMVELAEKLKNVKGCTQSSFDKQHQAAGVNHSLSMFDSEVSEGVSGSKRHQLSQHNINMSHNQHHSSASIPTQKILPLKKVAREQQHHLRGAPATGVAQNMNSHHN